jgi:hypothetical protein
MPDLDAILMPIVTSYPIRHPCPTGGSADKTKAAALSDRGLESRDGGGERAYSAASRMTSVFSTLAAQYLNSGILPKGSSCGLVRKLAAASLKQKGMNT